MENLEHKEILDGFAIQYQLTPREKEVVGQLLLQLTSTRQISESLGISTSTVRNHFENIFRKTDCENKCEVAVLLYKQLLNKVNDFQSLGRAPKVIVVDDNETMCNLLVSSLEHFGMSVTACYDPKEALELISIERYDCVISDIRMPNMDGVELLDNIRKNHPLWPFVILISGHHDYDTDTLLNYGAVDFVQKPFKVEEIYQLISNYYVDDLVERNRIMLLDREVDYKFSDLTIDLNQVSIGTGGAFIAFSEIDELKSAKVESVYDFTVTVNDFQSVVKVAGEIVWKKEDGIGIRFLTMTPQVDSFIKRHISKNKIQSFIPNS